MGGNRGWRMDEIDLDYVHRVARRHFPSQVHRRRQALHRLHILRRLREHIGGRQPRQRPRPGLGIPAQGDADRRQAVFEPQGHRPRRHPPRLRAGQVHGRRCMGDARELRGNAQPHEHDADEALRGQTRRTPASPWRRPSCSARSNRLRSPRSRAPTSGRPAAMCRGRGRRLSPKAT